MSIITDARMREWEVTVPPGMRRDLIWKFHTYRVALYLLYLAREDALRAGSGSRWVSICDQLVRSVASVSANIAEGYGRSMPRDRTRFYDIALGSLREAGTWYEAARAFLPDDTVNSRIDQLAELRRMLFGAIRALRAMPPERRIMG
jgi:four helix bundle protein